MPTAEIWVNPEDAEKYGIVNEGWVKVESRRGETYARALITNGIPARMVYQERFWNPELLENDPYGSWNAMNVNVLTKNDPPYNDVYGTYTLRGFQVRITPVDKNPYEGIWTEPKQFEPWLPLSDAANPGTATLSAWENAGNDTGTASTEEDDSWCPDPRQM